MTLADAPELIETTPATPTGWDLLTQPRRLTFAASLTAGLESGASRHAQQVQQVLVAASMAAGAILAVAAVMLLQLL